jgi:hypothetical protein
MDEQRTLNDLDPPAWPAPSPDDPTELVRSCNELRRTPSSRVRRRRSPDDGRSADRVAVSQERTTILEANPLAEHMYPGDLLGAVLRVDKAYWLANVGQWRGRGHRKRARSAYEELRDSIEAFTTSTF